MEDKDKRLPKQFGDFGEQLVMFIIGRLYEHRVAYVDHVGADLIATDGKKKYAISVKSRVIPESESKTQGFDEDQQTKLRDFAESFDLIPTVAFVFCEETTCSNDFNMDVYIIELDDFEALAESGETKGITKGLNNSLRFSNAKNKQHVLQHHDKINFQRLVVKANS